MKDLGRLVTTRFDTGFLDEKLPGTTALIIESTPQDKQVTILIPSMRVSQIATYLLASAQDSRKDMDWMEIDEAYRDSTLPTAIPEVVRINVDYEAGLLILDAGSGLLHFRLSDAVVSNGKLVIHDVHSSNQGRG